MKKLISLALALVMILSLATVAFADEIKYKSTDPQITKTYTVTGTAPAETFTFTATYKSYEGIGQTTTADSCKKPALTVAEAGYNAGDSGEKTLKIYTNAESKTFSADDFDIGHYVYEIKENVPTTETAGVTYDGTVFTLELDITWNTNHDAHVAKWVLKKGAVKTEEGFNNVYGSGSLSVTKTVGGDKADRSAEFAFTINFTAPRGETVKSSIKVTLPDSTNHTRTFGDDGTLTYTINLKHGQTVKFENLPNGVTYEVSEEAGSYTSDGGKFSDENKTISSGDADTVTFTNTLNSTANTGIVLDSMPYIILLTLAAAGMFVLLTKKRAREF